MPAALQDVHVGRPRYVIWDEHWRFQLSEAR
jgi:hypothetical protein